MVRLLLAAATAVSVSSSPLAAQARVVSAPEHRSLLDFVHRWVGEDSIGSLVSKSMEAADVEVRLWSGFGLGGTRGLILAGANGVWTANEVAVHRCFAVAPPNDELTPAREEYYRQAAKRRCGESPPDMRRVPAGSSMVVAHVLEVRAIPTHAGVQEAWEQAVSAGLLELPPGTNLMGIDGHTNVFEVRQGDEYRASVIRRSDAPDRVVERRAHQIAGVLWGAIVP